MVKISIKDLVCTNFTLQVLQSHYHPAKKNVNVTDVAALALGLANLSATCTGSYHATGSFSGNIEAVLATSLSSSSSDRKNEIEDHEDEDDPTLSDPIRLMWSIDSDYSNPLEILLPHKIRTSSCQSALRVPSLRFTGSISAHMIDWFRHSIQSYVEKEMNSQFCPALSSLLDPVLNQYLTQITTYLNQHLKWPWEDDNDYSYPLLSSPSLAVPKNHFRKNRNGGGGDNKNNNHSYEYNRYDPSRDDRAVRWSKEAPLLVNVLQSVNRFVASHLRQGFLPKWFPSLQHLNVQTCGFFFHGINGVIHSLLQLQNSQTDNDNDKQQVWYSLPLPPRLHRLVMMNVTSLYGRVDLDIYEIALAGFDQWSVAQIFTPTHTDTFETRLKTDRPIQIRMRATLNISSGTFSEQHDTNDEKTHVLHEDFTLTLRFANMDWNATLALWVDKEKWQRNVTTGLLMDVIKGLWPGSSDGIPRDSLQCLLGSILDFQAPQLDLSTLLQSMELVPTTPTEFVPRRLGVLLSETLEQALDDLFNRALELVIQEYPDYISSSIAGLVAGPLRTLLDDFLGRITNPTAYKDILGSEINGNDDDDSTVISACPVPNDMGESHLLNFSEVLPIQHLQEFMAKENTIRRVNEYIQCTADYLAYALGESATLGELLGMNNFAVQKENHENDSLYRLIMTNVSFHNIGQIDKLTLLEPVDDGLSLKGALVYGGKAETQEDLPHATVQFALELPNITAASNITLYWNELSLGGKSILHYNVNQLKSYGLARVFQHGHCLLVPVDDFEATSVDVAFGLFAAVVNTTVVLQNEPNEDESTTTLAYSLSTSEYPVVHKLASSILAWASNSSRDFINLVSIYSLSRASQLCGDAGHGGGSGKENSNGNHSQEGWHMALIIATMVILAQPVVCMFQESDSDPRQRQSHVTLTEPLLDLRMSQEHNFTKDRGVNVSYHGGSKSGSESEELALVDCPHVPSIARTGLPMLMLVTIFILLSSNLSVGATVELTASMGQKILHLPSLFEFSLFDTARQMWDAGIYPLLFLVVVFSGIWPYAKLIIMLYSFLSNKIRDGPRGQLLLAMDSLGKFSLVDTYVLVLMMVAFRYHLRFFDDDVIGLDVVVVPKYGFYGFLLATTLSLVAGHSAVYYHRVSEIRCPERGYEPQCPQLSILFGHAFQLRNSRQKLSRYSQFLLLLGWIAAAVLLGIGMTKESFVFKFGGLAGLALGEENRRTAYSLLSLGTSIATSSYSSFGSYVLTVVYFFYTVVAPFGCLYFLLILLVCPMSVQSQLRVLWLAEIANAWSAVEVFCLSIVAALLQISAFAMFIVGDRCDAINELIKDYWPSDQDISESSCYSVSSSVKWDVAFLVAGALLNSFVVSLSLRLVHFAMNDRVQQEGWVSLGIDAPFDSLSQPSSHGSFVERLFGISAVLSWLFFDPSNSRLYDVMARPAGEDENPESNSIVSPWEKDDGFVREWEKDAERDAAWKDWRNQPNTDETERLIPDEQPQDSQPAPTPNQND